MDYFLCVIGMVMVIEGLPYFAAPDKLKFVVSKILETDDAALRRFGFTMMLIGLFVVYLGRR